MEGVAQKRKKMEGSFVCPYCNEQLGQAQDLSSANKEIWTCGGCGAQWNWLRGRWEETRAIERHVSEAEWEKSEERASGYVVHPCDSWDKDKCFCRGAYGCHWVGGR